MFLHCPSKSDGSSAHRWTITAFAGTRPEAIKLAPLAIAAKNRPELDFRLIFSGQQPDLFASTLACFDIVADDVLTERRSPAARSVKSMKRSAARHLLRCPSHLALVQGDTSTALACAIAARSVGVPVGHVEAGLRSGRDDRPFPEEPNRRAIAQIANLHFAPSQNARANLIAEGVDGDISVTGNPVIDAMHMFARSQLPPIASDILLTCHRRENFGTVATGIAEGVRQLAASGFKILVPLHSNPEVAFPLRNALAGQPNVSLISPLAYPAMISALRSTRLVISDSGGLQEECAALGVPLVLLREETERPEVVASGNCRLVGSDPHRLFSEAALILSNPVLHRKMSTPLFPYGTGDAGNRILDAAVNYLMARHPQRVTSSTELALTR